MTEWVGERRFMDVPRGRDWQFKPGTSKFFARLGMKRCRQALARDLAATLVSMADVDVDECDDAAWEWDADRFYAASDWEYRRMDEDLDELEAA